MSWVDVPATSTRRRLASRRWLWLSAATFCAFALAVLGAALLWGLDGAVFVAGVLAFELLTRADVL